MSLILLLFLILFPFNSFGDVNSSNSQLLIQEQNGTNAGRYRVLQVTNGTSTNNGDGSIYVNTGGSGTGTNYWTLTNVGIGTTNNVGVGTITPLDTLQVLTGGGPSGVTINSVSTSLYGIDSNTQLALELNNNITDSSQNAATVTNNNITFANTTPKFSGRYYGVFNGTSAYATVPSASYNNFGSNNFTIGFWFYMSSTFNTTYYPIGKYSTTGPNGLFIDFSEGGTNNTFASQFIAYNAGSVIVNSNPASLTLTANAWHYYMVQRNGNNWTQYLDGTAIDTRVSASAVGSNSQPFSIGAIVDESSPTGYGFIPANIEDVVISSAVLSTTPPAFYLGSSFNNPQLTFQGGGTQTGFIGTNGSLSNNVQMGQGSSVALNISPSENVGIGSTAPGALLDVYGTIRALNFSNGLVNTGTVGQVAYYASSTTAVSPVPGSGLVYISPNIGIGSATPGQLLDVQGTIRGIGEFINGNVGIGTNANQAALSVMNGNVGIGTWAPTTTVQVNGTLNATIVQVGGNAVPSPLTYTATGITYAQGAANYVISSNSTNVGSYGAVINGNKTPASFVKINSVNPAITGNGDFIQMNVGNVGIGTITAITIQSGGNVGIGTLGNGNVGIGTVAGTSLLSFGGGCATHTSQTLCITTNSSGACLGYCNGGLSAVCGTCTCC